jgi:hypothetical protein
MQDLVRMADASIAAIARDRITIQSGSATLAIRMVPVAASETKYLSLAKSLNSEVQAQTGLRSPLVLGGPTAELPDVTAIPRYIQGVIDSVVKIAPKVGPLVQQPSVQQMAMNLSSRILQRMVARSVKVATAGPLQ